MLVRTRMMCGSVALLAALAAGRGALLHAAQQPADSDGWQLPPGAAAEPNPIPASPEVLAKGQALYKSKCQKCHGPGGRGDGPDADADHKPGDLTDARRASRNPDGVMFYKVWNGRTKPKMPAFKTDISRTDVWTVVQFVKTLRQ